nr:MAG TPA: hypothetical protein [Bacteriophage sp.]
MLQWVCLIVNTNTVWRDRYILYTYSHVDR